MWNKFGTVISACKFQKNPLKNIIFDKKAGIDLMKDHFLCEGPGYQVFTNDTAENGVLGRLV